VSRGRTPNLPELTILREVDPDSAKVPTYVKGRKRRAIYKAIMVDLMRRAIWIDTFGPTVEVLAGALLDYRTAREHLDKDGPVIETELGPIISPWHIVAKDSAAVITRLGKEFGWTISSLYGLLRAATGNEYRRQMIMEGNSEKRSEKAALLPFEHA